MAIRHYWDYDLKTFQKLYGTGAMMLHPLVLGDDLRCIIANPSKWVETFGRSPTENTSLQEWLIQNDIEVEGCAITFPNIETKTLFLLKFS